MAPNIYPDQNALIYLSQKSQGDAAFRTKLFQALHDDKLKIVLSPWHWVETARDRDVNRASELAEFMDELEPVWLRDRRDLERIEVEDGFFRFARVAYKPPPALISRAELLSAMNRVKLGEDAAPSSREFVEGWIKDPKLMEPIVQSQEKNAEALVRLREALSSGELTAIHKREGDRKLIEGFLPERTPQGIVLDPSTKEGFLNSVTPKSFATLAIEADVAEYSWRAEGRTGWNSMVDKFHLISALPYVDVLVSDDRYFSTLLPVATKTGFVKARVLKFADFLAEFLP